MAVDWAQERAGCTHVYLGTRTTLGTGRQATAAGLIYSPDHIRGSWETGAPGPVILIHPCFDAIFSFSYGSVCSVKGLQRGLSVPCPLVTLLTLMFTHLGFA